MPNSALPVRGLSLRTPDPSSSRVLDAVDLSSGEKRELFKELK